MKSAVETLEPTRVKLTVEVPVDELAPSIEHAYAHIAKDVSIPGFRKGKVPARIIDQRIGFGAVIEHAVNDALPGFYREAAKEAGISPLGQPEVEVTAVPTAKDSGELTFTAEVDVRPEITLPELAELTVTVDSIEVADDEVDERIEVMRQRFGTLAGVERAAKDTDFVVLDLTATIEGEEVDTVSGVSYQIGSGNMLEGLDDAVTGLKPGESVTFTAPLAGGERAGEEAEVVVTISAVKEQELPELDDEFAQLASEFDTLAELTDDVRTQAASGKVDGQAVQARDKLLDVLLESVDFPVPASVVEAEVHRHLQGENRLEDDAHRAEVTEEATDSLRRQLLLDVLAEQLRVGVKQDELIDFLVRTAQQYRVDPNEFVQNADKTGQIPVFVGEIARNKALALALRSVTVVDADGNGVDLTPYIGSYELDAIANGEAPAPESDEAESDDAAKSDDATADAEAPAEKPKAARKAPAKKKAAAADAPADDAKSDDAEEKPKAARKAPAKKAPAKKAPATKAAATDAAAEDAPVEEKPKAARKAPAKKAADKADEKADDKA